MSVSKAEWVKAGRKHVRLSSITIVHHAWKRVTVSGGIHIDCGDEEFNNILELLGLK